MSKITQKFDHSDKRSVKQSSIISRMKKFITLTVKIPKNLQNTKKITYVNHQ